MELVTIVFLFLLYPLLRSILSVFGFGRPKNLPPGPTPLPIIGNLLLLGNQPHRSLAKLSEIHGPIMFLKFGRTNTLVISSAEAAKQLFQKHDRAFSSRHIPDALTAHNHSQYSVVWLPVATQWRTLRKILNSNIFSKNSLDSNQKLRSQKVHELVEYCRKASLSKDSVNIGQGAFRTTLNLLSNTIFSKDLTEDLGREFKELVEKIMAEAGKPNLVDFFPVLRWIDPQRSRARMTHYFEKVFEIFDELIKERMCVDQRLKKEEDVLDVCLKISQENPHEVHQAHIKSLFLDLFVAGTDTTSNTLEWAMTEVVHNSSIMAKAKMELQEVIGKGKIIEEIDVLRLPYLWCIIKETLRIHPPASFLIPRKLKTQLKLNGYTIPPDTQVLVNTWAIGQDMSIWEDPSMFKPERFLTSMIDVRGRNFELIPFGAGRRVCPGLPLALRMLPMMLGSLLNNFDWNLEVGFRQHKELDMT